MNSEHLESVVVRIQNLEAERGGAARRDPAAAPSPTPLVKWVQPTPIDSGGGATPWRWADTKGRLPHSASAAIVRFRYSEDVSSNKTRFLVKASEDGWVYEVSNDRMTSGTSDMGGSFVQLIPCSNGGFWYRETENVKDWQLDLYGYIE